MEVLEKVEEYLKEAKIYYLCTEDDDQPKCRPMGFHKLIDGQLYFGLGDFKEVYKQMCKNPKVEIVACKGSDWLRVYGTAVFETDYNLANAFLANAEGLKKIYNEETGYHLAVFHLKQATAEFRSMMAVEESYKF